MLVYTAIYGNYDKLPKPQVTGEHTYVCITDDTKPKGVWTTEKKTCSLSPRRCSRHAKIVYYLHFPNEEITIWHGGNVRLKGDLTALANLLNGTDIAAVRHSQRDCIYDEAQACIRWELDNKLTIKEQMARYRKAGYPSRNGLHTAFLIVRRNTKKMRKFADLWWNEVRRGSHRDQLSFDYCLWKMKIEPAIIPGNIYEGPNYQRTGLHN